MKMKITLFFLIILSISLNAQNSKKDSISGEEFYKKHFNCDYNEGNVIVVQRKGKKMDPNSHNGLTKSGFIIRMEAIYDLEFTDDKRYRTSIVKKITNDSITLTSTFNEKSAKYEGIKYELITYPIKDIKKARFINDRSLGIYLKRNILKKYDLIVKKIDKAKMCPAVLTFTKRNNEVKVCHYYLTSQGWNILFETNGFIDFLEYRVDWQ